MSADAARLPVVLVLTPVYNESAGPVGVRGRGYDGRCSPDTDCVVRSCSSRTEGSDDSWRRICEIAFTRRPIPRHSGSRELRSHIALSAGLRTSATPTRWRRSPAI